MLARRATFALLTHTLGPRRQRSNASRALALICFAFLAACASQTDGSPQAQEDNLFAELREINPPPAPPGSLTPGAALLEAPRYQELDTSHIVIKFHEGASVRLREQSFIVDDVETLDQNTRLERAGLNPSNVRTDLQQLNALLTSAEAQLARPADEVAEDDLLLLRLAAEANTNQEQPDLNLFYYIFPSGPESGLDDLIEQLNAFDSVELAYVPPIPVNAADRPPTTNVDLGQSLDYFGAAPIGVDVEFARSTPGGRGEDIRIVDIEYGWRRDHEDFPPSHRVLVDIGAPREVEHGTAVIGQLWAEDNGFGMTGMVPDASVGRISPLFDQPRRYSVPEALVISARHLRRGDIVLIEQQYASNAPCTRPGGCSSQFGMVPVESDPFTFAAIANLTGAGIIVIEAAGNGEQNVDRDPARDSGAIMVGAGDPRTRVPSWFTNYGSRIDVHAWGVGIGTLGYGSSDHLRANGVDPTQWYTNDFGGTSGASPIVVGVAAIVQSNRRQSGLPLLDSVQMRALLVGTGTSQAPSTQQIGPLPDLRSALANN